MTYNMIKTQIFLHKALDYNQIYNFTLNHYYKFKIIIVFKDVWISKSKSIYVFVFLNVWRHGSFLVKYIKVHQKFEMIWWTFDKGKKKVETKKPHVHMFFLSVLNV